MHESPCCSCSSEKRLFHASSLLSIEKTIEKLEHNEEKKKTRKTYVTFGKKESRKLRKNARKVKEMLERKVENGNSGYINRDKKDKRKVYNVVVLFLFLDFSRMNHTEIDQKEAE